MIKIIQKFLLFFIAFSANTFITSVAYAQGIAAIAPLSRATTDANEEIRFTLQNLSENEIALRYDPECDINGVDKKGGECLKFFEMQFSQSSKNSIFYIPKNERLEGIIKLNSSKNLIYALFKPSFTPVEQTKTAKSGVNFTFSYQPGYLYLIQPNKTKLQLPKFKNTTVNGMQRAHIEFDLSNITIPFLTNISATIIDNETKKIIRFLPLAREKIIDPKRKKITLEGDFAKAGTYKQVCYEIFVENRFANDTYKLSGCQ